MANDKYMPNPLSLLDPKFIPHFFSQKITSPQYKNINWQTLKITSIKKNIYEKDPSLFYHLVIRYDVLNLNQPIFCTAHSKETRQRAYEALKFINTKIENQKIIPLFYDQKFNGLFYLGFNGENLQYYIKNSPNKLQTIVKSFAAWLASLHQIKADPKKHNFNPENSQIKTVVPGSDYYLKKIKKEIPAYFNAVKNLFDQINNFDQENSLQNGHYLIHGDAHPENIIINEKTNQIAVIDYTDICLADFTRDLANFSCQLNYMVNRFNPDLAKNLPGLEHSFLNSYFEKTKLNFSPDLKKRINFYKSWTALRSAVFFLTKQFRETEEAEKMLTQAKKYLSNQ